MCGDGHQTRVGDIGAELLWAAGEARYERRLIAYFDILGWRDWIERAGSDPHRIGQLRAVIQLFSIFQRPGFVPTEPGALLTSFSDNVVVSTPFDPVLIPQFLEGIGRVQLGSACLGFFVRGAITVGNLFHDREAVFGPALIRAYELESRNAVNPRVILDPDVTELRVALPSFVSEDGDFRMVDPFTIQFLHRVGSLSTDPQVLARYRASLGIREPTFAEAHPQVSSAHVLHAILGHLGRELARPLRESDRSKLAWLFDRLAAHLGVGIRAAELPRP